MVVDSTWLVQLKCTVQSHCIIFNTMKEAITWQKQKQKSIRLYSSCYQEVYLDWQNGNYRIQNTELTHSHDCIKFSNGSFSLLLRNFNWWMIFCFQSRTEVDMSKNPGRKISPILNHEFSPLYATKLFNFSFEIFI